MSLTESRDVGELYRSDEYKEFAKLLTDLFHQQVYGLIRDIELTHPYVGFTHFRDNVLAPHVAHRLGNISSALILDYMIKNNMIEVHKYEHKDGGFPVSAIRKVTDNGDSTASSLS